MILPLYRLSYRTALSGAYISLRLPAVNLELEEFGGILELYHSGF